MSDSLEAAIQLIQAIPKSTVLQALARMYPQSAPQVTQVAQQHSAYDPNVGYTDQYNTKLTPEQETSFQAWMKESSKKEGRDTFKDLYDYDMRGAWLHNAQAAANGHLPDTWKKPNEPTFSTQSQYSTPQMTGGVWARLPDGTWTYKPSVWNLKMNSLEDLQHIWAAQQPGAKLILPSGVAWSPPAPAGAQHITPQSGVSPSTSPVLSNKITAASQ